MGHNTWVYESNSRNLSVWLSLTQLSKMLHHSYSTKSVTGAEGDLPETEEGRGEGWVWGVGWRNDPNNVCICE
jgi:hypothetical protein